MLLVVGTLSFGTVKRLKNVVILGLPLSLGGILAVTTWQCDIGSCMESRRPEVWRVRETRSLHVARLGSVRLFSGASSSEPYSRVSQGCCSQLAGRYFNQYVGSC